MDGHLLLRLGGVVVTCAFLTIRTWAWILAVIPCQSYVTHGMSFTLHSNCLVVFPRGFSSTIGTTWNCSDCDKDCFIRMRMAWPDIDLGAIKHGFVFVFVFLQYLSLLWRLKDVAVLWKTWLLNWKSIDVNISSESGWIPKARVKNMVYYLTYLFNLNCIYILI